MPGITELELSIIDTQLNKCTTCAKGKWLGYGTAYTCNETTCQYVPTHDLAEEQNNMKE